MLIGILLFSAVCLALVLAGLRDLRIVKKHASKKSIHTAAV